MSDSYNDFLVEFGGEEACEDFFFQCRWPSGYVCPTCGQSEHYIISTRRMPLYECKHCRTQTSVTSGTALERTRTPLSKWLFTMKLLSDPLATINAVQLSKLLRVTYKTAFSILDTIRHCLSLSTPDKLTGQVQAGLAFFGKPCIASTELSGDQHPIAVAVSIDDSGKPLRLAMMAIPRHLMYGSNILPIGVDSVKDRFFSSDTKFKKDTSVCRSLLLTYRNCKSLVPLFKSCFKQLNDAYHGVHPRSLSKYLAEITFRWNAATGPSDALQRLSESCFAYSRTQLAA